MTHKPATPARRAAQRILDRVVPRMSTFLGPVDVLEMEAIINEEIERERQDRPLLNQMGGNPMTEPKQDTCPWCEADMEFRHAVRMFACGSYVSDSVASQSDKCRIRQLTQQNAKLLEACRDALIEFNCLRLQIKWSGALRTAHDKLRAAIAAAEKGA